MKQNHRKLGRIAVALAACAAVCGLVLSLQGEEERRLEWSLSKDACAEYRISEVKNDGSTRELKDSFFLILWHEISPAGDFSHHFSSYEDIGIEPLLCLPDCAAARGDKWQKTFTFSDLADVPAGLFEKAEAAVANGLVWLEINYSVRRNPKSPSLMRDYYYYLYSVERVGSLTGSRRFGKYNWYFDGCMMLLNLQQANGFWTNPQSTMEDNSIVATSLALLFLSRATIPVYTK